VGFFSVLFFFEDEFSVSMTHYLTDLAGEKVDIPSGLVAGPPPTNTDFYFSDLTYDSQI
jgi:engulfment and cell motility protein 1